MLMGPFDIGARLFMFRHWVGGYWQPNGTSNVDVWRRFLPAIGAALVSCWVVAPFEIANKAYWADLKYPVELRRNYKSPLNALWRLPVEEGFSFLFKNSLPTMAGAFVESLSLFFITDYLLDWSRFFHFENDMAYAPLKAASISIAILLSGLASFPFKYTARRIIELYPSEMGGQKYNYQYRKGLLNAMTTDHYSGNYHGFARYLWIKGPRYFIMLWVAEWLGLFRSWRTSFFSFPGINVFGEIHG